MSKPLVVTRAAIEEAAEAIEWYEARAPQVVPRFISELRTAFDAIPERPASFAHLAGPYRFALLKSFPYLVIFRELEAEVEVVAVAHGRKRPGYWKSRRRG